MPHRVITPPDRHQRVEDDAVRLLYALREAEALLPVLSALLPETGGRGTQTGVIGRHAPRSSEPWQAEAASAYWTIHAGLREMVNDLRIDRGLYELAWSGHDGETGRVIARIRNLVPVVSADAVRDAAKRAESWVTAARQITDIDEAERWTPVPRVPGAKPPACPYCRTFSLRMARHRGEVRCSFPGCRDGDGNPTRARMEFGARSGEAMLVFGDDTTLHYREEAAS